MVAVTRDILLDIVYYNENTHHYIFLIRLIRSNVGHLIAAEVLKGLYELIVKDSKKQSNAASGGSPTFKHMVESMGLNRRPSSTNSDSKVEVV